MENQLQVLKTLFLNSLVNGQMSSLKKKPNSFSKY